LIGEEVVQERQEGQQANKVASAPAPTITKDQNSKCRAATEKKKNCFCFSIKPAAARGLGSVRLRPSRQPQCISERVLRHAVPTPSCTREAIRRKLH
jgi:hypothetical protein